MMNETLFEKLIDEAELDIVWDKKNPSYRWVEGTEQDLKKFAELIVRECVGVELYWLSKQDRNAVAEKIKQHFGVEE